MHDPLSVDRLRSPPAAGLSRPASAERIKDLGGFQGIRTNQLTGYGIVVGLAGTGDDNLEYTIQSMKARGVALRAQSARRRQPGPEERRGGDDHRRTAAFAKPGQKIDITVASMGKAKSLRGGALILTPLMGADGQIYAMAQGNLAVGGLGIEGKDGSQIVVNVPSTGRIPEGATVERAVETGFDDHAHPHLQPRPRRTSPPRRTSQGAINGRFGAGVARGGRRRVDPRQRARRRRYPRRRSMSEIENLDVVSAEPPAKVIVNARTGTVVINSAVRVGPAAVTHGKLTVRIDEKQTRRPARAVQPGPDRDRAEIGRRRSTRRSSPMFLLAARAQARRHRQGGERDRRLAGRPRRDPRGAQGSRRAQGRADHPVTDILPPRPRRQRRRRHLARHQPAGSAANLEKAGEKFEAVFIGMMLKSMRQAKLGDGLFDSKAHDTFRDMQDKQVAAEHGRASADRDRQGDDRLPRQVADRVAAARRAAD